MSAPDNTRAHLERRFFEAVRESYRRTQEEGGPRSTKRIRVLHGWAQQEIARRLGADYALRGYSDDGGKEEEVSGWYYIKRVDVSVSRDERVLGVVSVKFVNSNFRQNAYNYFEGQMGETANLRRNDIVFGSVFCVTHPIPYFRKSGILEKFEEIQERDIERYYLLERDHNHPHAPDVQAFCIFRLDWDNRNITRICVRDDLPHLSDAMHQKLQSMNIGRFFTQFCDHIRLKYNSRREG